VHGQTPPVALAATGVEVDVTAFERLVAEGTPDALAGPPRSTSGICSPGRNGRDRHPHPRLDHPVYKPGGL
jgi:hypothetical protein